MQPFVVAAGGTGGHLFPAEALAAELVRRGGRVVLMTDARAQTGQCPTLDVCERFVLRGAGIAGRGARRGAAAAAALVAGTVQARRILRRLQPAVVVGFGGYPSVAPILAAALTRPRPRIVLHEQNAVLGRANRFLARRADLAALSFAETRRMPPGVRCEVTGNPLRPAIVARAGAPYPPLEWELRLLVLGGSLGARVFSDVVPAALAGLPKGMRQRLRVVQQCRAEDLDRVRAAYAEAEISAELASFFADVPERLASAHLVVARAGASTVAELATIGRPSILVPLPGAIDDHQTANAAALAQAGGAWPMAQAVFTPDSLRTRIAVLGDDPVQLRAAAEACARLARPDAARRLADAVEAMIGAEVSA